MPRIAAPMLIGVCLAGDGPPDGEAVLLRHCKITYERTTTIAAFVLVQAGGRVQDCYVRPGDRVKAGRVLARLHDRDAVIELERLRVVSQSDIDVRLGESKLAVAQARLRRAEALHAQRLVSLEDLQVIRLDAQAAGLEAEQARRRRHVDQLLTRRMQVEVRSRELVASSCSRTSASRASATSRCCG